MLHPAQRPLFKTAHDDRQTLLESRKREQLRISNHFQNLNANGPAHVIFIACSARKLDQAAPAKNLYTGQLYKKSRAYAEHAGHTYFILSALHGLLRPDKTTEPYNFTLKRLRHRERLAWANRVANSVVWHVPTGSTITLLAGRDYAEPLESILTQKGFIIERPLRGLAIGQQQQKLIALTTKP